VDEGLLSVDSNSGVWEDEKLSFTELCGSMDSVLFGGLDSTSMLGVEGGLLSPSAGGIANKSSHTELFGSADPVVFSGLVWFLGLDEVASAEVWVACSASELSSVALSGTDLLLSSDTVSNVDLVGALFIALSLRTGQQVPFAALLPILSLL
jgi:hypothetical protein